MRSVRGASGASLDQLILSEETFTGTRIAAGLTLLTTGVRKPETPICGLARRYWCL
jgi:hypothetical protein